MTEECAQESKKRKETRPSVDDDDEGEEEDEELVGVLEVDVPHVEDDSQVTLRGEQRRELEQKRKEL